MNTELSFEYRVLGGSVEDAIHAIHQIRNTEQLVHLKDHEDSHMKRRTVFRALQQRISHLSNKNRKQCHK